MPTPRVTLLFTLFAFAAAVASDSLQAAPPNLVLIMADDKY